MIKIGWRIWLVIIFLLFSLLTISPTFKQGVIIKSIEKNSSIYEAGVRQGMILQSINGIEIKTIEDYTKIISNIFPNNYSNFTKVIITADKQEFIVLINKFPDITLGKIPRTNLKTGLDLSGGARALVKPINASLSDLEINDLISITSERFNNFGLKDITIRSTKDLSGNNYMLVEIAGATPSDLRELVGQQGKFEAKIGNQTVFIGAEKDITSVCRTDATCARIETCFQTQDGSFVCKFIFTIYLSEEAAKRHAEITSKIPINISDGRYLEKQLDLFLDNNLFSSLYISKDLKGRETTQVAVSGTGTGKTKEDAFNAAKQEMHKLQTILITGSLPYELEIVKLDTISPVLGEEFMNNILFLAVIVFLIISLILFVRYRKIKITFAVIMTMFSEAFITLGIAALIKWNLDAPSIAGIIAGMGTGVNDQIVMIEESISNVSTISLKDRIKRALSIIVAAFLTIIAAMIPLFWAGAGMLRGFALTTIIGVSIGILITRPAFADLLKKLEQ